MVDVIFKPMTKIYNHAYGLLKIFVLSEKEFSISPKIFFEKIVIFTYLKTSPCYMGQALCNMGHPFLHFLFIAEG